MIELNFFFDRNQKYPLMDLDSILKDLDELGSSGKGIHVSKVEKSVLGKKEIQDVVEEIRRIKPQSRGSVVASRGEPLPISGSKNLNLGNTPVLLVRDETGPVYVFPCRLGETYYSLKDGIEFLKVNLPELPELLGGTEDSIIHALASSPNLLESCLETAGVEKETPTGKSDLILTDKDGKTLIVEVEREATDSAIGQILRLCAGYESEKGVKVRAGIACIRINPNVLAAAVRAGIEVWQIDLGDNPKTTKLAPKCQC